MEKLEQSIKNIEKEIEETLERTIDMIDVYKVSLDTALKNQLLLQLEWEVVSKKARRVASLAELLVDETYAKAFKEESNNSYKALSTTEIREYSKANPVYLRARRLLIAATEVKEEAAGLLDVVTSRKYVLNNLTNAIIASCEKEIL